MATLTLPRPAERVAILSLVLVFLCGIVAGALVMSYWGYHITGTSPGGISLTTSINEWQRELGLSDDQTRRLNSVLDDFSHYYDNLLADGNSRIMQILNPEQQKKYEQMMRARRK